MNAPRLKLPEVYSRYGAPMGRPTFSDGTPTRARLSRMRLVDGDYDQGGAYWGGPGPIYWLRDDAGTVQDFIRAGSRHEAAAVVAEDYPEVTLLRGEK